MDRSSAPPVPPNEEVITQHIDEGLLIKSSTAIELTPKINMDDFYLPGSGQLPIPTKIIMTYLPAQVTEQDLRILCATKGHLRSFRLIMDPVTGERRGYAFAEYERPEEAITACNDLNGLMVHDKRIKVCLARPQDPQIRNANLHISQFPKSWTIINLYNYFRYLGQVIACKILLDTATGDSKGIAFVRFATHKQADDVRSQVNGMTPPGEREPWIITYAHANGPNRAKRQPLLDGISKTLQIGLSSMADLNATLPTPGEQSTASTNASVSSIDQDAQNARRAKQRFRPASWPIFVGNLGMSHNETYLRMLFEQYGAIESVKLMVPGGPHGGGYGFVNMYNPDEAFTAIQHLANTKLAENHYLTVQVKSIQPRPPGQSPTY